MKLEAMRVMQGAAEEGVALWAALASLPNLTWLVLGFSGPCGALGRRFFLSLSVMTNLR